MSETKQFRKLRFITSQGPTDQTYEIPLVGKKQMIIDERTNELLGYGEIFNNDNNQAGLNAHAEGYSTEAHGNCSHAEGLGTSAYGDCQHVSGKYNIPDEDGQYAVIIGNGNIETINQQGDQTLIQSNAYTLDWEGNAIFAGGITANNDITSKGGKVITTNENQNLDDDTKAKVRKALGIINPNEYIHIGPDAPTNSQCVIWINPYSAT